MEENLRLRLQKDDKIRGGNASAQKLKDLLIEGEFVFIKVQEGKNPILVKEIIGEGDLVEEIELRDLLLLLKPGK